MTQIIARDAAEKRQMAEILQRECPEALEILKTVSKVFGPVQFARIAIGEPLRPYQTRRQEKQR